MTQTSFEQLAVVTVQIVQERPILYNGERLSQPEQAAKAFQTFLGNPDRECMVAFLVDGKNRITSVHLVSQGSLNQTIVHPREVYKAACLANSAGLIICHNHPTGDTTPSREDIEITRRLKEAGEILGIKLIDHLIIDTETGKFNSFINCGLL